MTVPGSLGLHRSLLSGPATVRPSGPGLPLRSGRPTTTARAVFVRSQAPYRALCSTSVSGIVRRWLASVGVRQTGKRGAHVLRHSRAVSLLRGGVSLKIIGDVLGHRAERSTAPYLKLATEDLRSVALDLPAGVTL